MISTQHGPVVVGVDGSDEAARAAVYGAWEAQRRLVPLRLVFAVQPPPMWGSATLVTDDERGQQWVGDVLRRAEKDVAEAHPRVVVETAVIAASPAAALVDESRRASLVVVGTRATAGIKGHVNGSVAAQIAAHATVPLVVLRPGPNAYADPAAFAGRPVIVGLDGSVESQRALEFAVDEAVARNVGVHAVFVWNVRDLSDIGPIVVEHVTRAEEATAVRLVIEATEGWSDRYPDLVITNRVIHAADTVDALTDISADASLIVVGSRGRGGFLGLRLGSTGDGLIRRAGTAVAVVPIA